MRALQTLMRRVPGGLALCVVIARHCPGRLDRCDRRPGFFGDVAIKPMLDDKYRPEMARRRRRVELPGILIPPSIMLIIMSDQPQLPVGDLFMAAVFPGLMLGAFYAAYVIGHALPSGASHAGGDGRIG